MTAIKKLLSDPSAAETLPPDLLRLLIDCPSHHLEAYCDYLMLDSIPAIGLNALAQELTWFKLELSHLNAVVLARRCFLKQVKPIGTLTMEPLSLIPVKYSPGDAPGLFLPHGCPGHFHTRFWLHASRIPRDITSSPPTPDQGCYSKGYAHFLGQTEG